ncbi:MAG: pseudouridine synthase [Acidimicrobiales bacterium]
MALAPDEPARSSLRRDVTVNGIIAELGQRADEEHDEVAVNGVVMGSSLAWSRISFTSRLCCYDGLLIPRADERWSTWHQTRHAPTRSWAPDYETEGLLLLTNDGDLTHRLTHPSFGVEKEYLAELEGRPSRAAIRSLREGVELEDGRTAPAKVAPVGETGLRITIHEGRNRQVRRMCEAVGFPVRRLIRTRIGVLTDTKLRASEWRELEPTEILALRHAVGLSPIESPPVG